MISVFVRRPVMDESEYEQNVQYATLVDTEVAAVTASDADSGGVFGEIRYFVTEDTSNGLFTLDPTTGKYGFTQQYDLIPLL